MNQVRLNSVTVTSKESSITQNLDEWVDVGHESLWTTNYKLIHTGYSMRPASQHMNVSYGVNYYNHIWVVLRVSRLVQQAITLIYKPK